ncbi:MnhB domain-containing protein [Acrocarpospora catenulata]|uniref:MnhB domain-containing protein n=1 Tax=Acrocarpospora catenulata TaxID=2836182 RepID=UPI0027E109B0|nr:MnhB domain-containing protein [Acrocarpospora catenulata]
MNAVRGLRLCLLAAGSLGFAVLFTLAVLDLPPFGGNFHPYGDRAVRASLLRGTPNTVSSVNFDQRSLDTLGEELILVASALGAVVLLRAVRREEEDEPARHHLGPADVFDALRVTGYPLLPVTVLVGVYIVAHGQLSPGGGFQGGVVLGTALHLLYLTGDYPALARIRPVPLFEVGETAAAAVFVVLALAFAGQVIASNVAVGVEVGCAFVLVLAKFFEQALLIRVPA